VTKASNYAVVLVNDVQQAGIEVARLVSSGVCGSRSG